MARKKAQKSATVKKQQQEEIEDVLQREAKKPREQETAEKEAGIEALFRSHMHSMIEDIEKAALLSEHANLLATGAKPEKADQEMLAFKEQVDLAGRENHQPSPEEAGEEDFKVIITSDKEEEEEENDEKK
ncbi:hypothetical protein EMPG_11164 [Blastomyces silverae]|uniref:Uncharacterized protein n=1 Tax=Blastomyces silverae TaxID=2060906 RepID=A0A0H1B2S8_9EURO|nr:hypothetical protein EMPG_11164 [Blastomyces silverae]